MIPLGVTASQALQEGSLASPVPSSGLLYWLEADFGLFTGDAGTTPATTEGDGISRWQNRGSAGDVVQSVGANRPELYGSYFGFESWGVSVYNSFSAPTFFEDLVFSQPSGDDYNPWTCVIVTPGGVSLNQRPRILASGVANGKMDFYWSNLAPAPSGQTYLAGRHMAEPDFIWSYPGTWVARAEIVDTGPSVHTNLRFDGAQVADLSAAPGSSAAVPSTQFLRDTVVAPNGYFNRNLFAFLFWDRYLTDPEVAEVEAYLAGKYPVP